MANLELIPFTGGLPAARVDAALKSSLAVSDRARECAVLWFAEVMRRQLYRDLGFASLELYATDGLGFSRDRMFQFKRLAADLERLPRLQEAVVAGDLGWTKAQQVARVATPASEEAWVARALTVGRRELADDVKKARGKAKARRQAAAGAELALGGAGAEPALGGATAVDAPVTDPPTTVSFRLDGLQLARYEALIEQAYKDGRIARGASREEMLLSALAALVEGPDLCRQKSRKQKSPNKIFIRRCPDCEREAAITSHGEKALSRAQSDAIACDGDVVAEDGRQRSAIPPSARATVLARDRHRCTQCGTTHFLEVHHVRPRAAGGSNKAENLTTLCSRCHRYLHDRAAASCAQPPVHARL